MKHPDPKQGARLLPNRPWKELQEPSKLAILQDAVDWSGVTNRDQATILLSEIDPGRITEAQRSRLIEAAAENSYKEMLQEASALGGGSKGKDRDMER